MMQSGTLTRGLAALVVTLVLGMLSIWLLTYGREQRHRFYQDYVFSAPEAQRLSRHPDMLYAFGRQAESTTDTVAAADYFGRAVTRNPLHLDAWLRLAGLTAAGGGAEQARRIVAFCARTAAPVVRWKWHQTLLAHDLGMDDLLGANINFLVARGMRVDLAMYLLENHYQADVGRVLAVLEPPNRPAYLHWAIRRQRTDAAEAAWAAVAADARAHDVRVDDESLTRYVHFLVDLQAVPAARQIWHAHTGIAGMTNAGFESEISGRGFDWRVASDRSGNWTVQRAAHEGRNGGQSLRVTFAGRDNINFYHVRQVVPVTPQRPHSLNFWWKSHAITTDQAPFVEVTGYDARGLQARSVGLGPGSHDWQAATVSFTPPHDCHAVVVRLRRLPSGRFDRRIQGTLWLDDFDLTAETTDQPPGQR